MTFKDPEKEEVWFFIRALNDSWTKEKGERVSEFFHPRMVAMTPVDKFRLKGASECVAGWQRFPKMATTHFFREYDPDIELFGDTAVVTYYYDIEATMGGARQKFTGRDMFTLKKEGGRWWVIADHYSASPPERG